MVRYDVPVPVVVTALDIPEGPEPEKFTAPTPKVYVAPPSSSVKLALVVAPFTTTDEAGMLPRYAVATYDVTMGRPAGTVAAVHVTLAALVPGVATTLVGASGTVVWPEAAKCAAMRAGDSTLG